MDDAIPRSQQPTADVERLASLDRLTELFDQPGLTRDRLLAAIQEESHVLRAEAARAKSLGDRTLARQLDLMAAEVARLGRV
ncbi:MAG TPA: hypothetical protein VGH89_37090, partial [Pseudonocardia sp.]